MTAISSLHDSNFSPRVRPNRQNLRSISLRQALCCILAGYFAVSVLWQSVTNELLTYVDEAVVVLLILLAVFSGRGVVPKPALQIFAVVVALFVWGSLCLYFNPVMFQAPRIELALRSSIIDLKPIALTGIFLILLLQMTSSDQRKTVHFVCWTFITLSMINLPFCLLDMVRGTDLHGSPLLMRAGFYIPQGLYHHKYMAAFTALMGVISAISLRSVFKNRVIFLLLLFVLLINVTILLSAKEIISSALILALAALNGARGKRLFAVLLVAGLAVSVSTISNPISDAIADRLETFGGTNWEETTRGALYNTAPKVANDYFPLGSGWGTYGSSPSRDVYYSPLYYIYGLANVWGGSKAFGDFLIDTFWPRIIAEQGWIGFALYIWLWVVAGRVAIHLLWTRDRNDMQNFALFSYVSLFIIALATPIYNYADGSLITGLSMALLFPHSQSKRHRARSLDALS